MRIRTAPIAAALAAMAGLASCSAVEYSEAYEIADPVSQGRRTAGSSPASGRDSLGIGRRVRGEINRDSRGELHSFFFFLAVTKIFVSSIVPCLYQRLAKSAK